MMHILISFLLTMSGGRPIHQGHTWWVGEFDTSTFDAQPGDTINVWLVPDWDANAQCDDMGGVFYPPSLCKGVDF